MKKTIIASVLALALVAVVSPVFAFGNNNYQPSRHFDKCCEQPKDKCCPEVKVNTINNLTLHNSVWAVSNTGFNAIKGDDGKKKHCRHYGSSGNATITTGDATAINEVDNYVTNDVKVNAPDKGKLEVNTVNNATINNHVVAVANTGVNLIVKKGDIDTGDAYSGNGVVNLVDNKVDVY